MLIKVQFIKISSQQDTKHTKKTYIEKSAKQTTKEK
jgi:hypothetical protein